MTQETIDPAVPVTFDDPLNARILAVSEDKIQGFQIDPIGAISRLSGVDRPLVIERIAAMLRAGHPLDSARELVDARDVAAAEEWAAQVSEDGPCD